jgi:exonuclease VII small subunit
MDQMKELIVLLEEKLLTIREAIDAYEEGMDYVTHCTLQGFAEGLMYAIEEIRNRAT